MAKLSDAKASMEGVRQGATSAKSGVSSAQGTLSSARSQLDGLAAELPRLQDAAKTAADKMSDFSNAAMEAHAAILQALAALENVIPPEDYEKLKQQAESVSKVLDDALLPAASNAMFALNSASGQLAGAISGQQTMVGELDIALDELDGVLDAAIGALSQTEGLLDEAYAGMDGIRTDLVSLSEADTFGKLLGPDGLDAERIASFMGSPTEVETEQMYSLNAYGSAMAPLFMNLTFWIGAFMLLVIMRQEVDGEGVDDLTLTQRYVGRFLLFAILAVLQAVVCVAGVLAIGVEAASPPALFFASAVASLSYLSIIYALSVTLQHIGKGICIVLVFAQDPRGHGAVRHRNDVGVLPGRVPRPAVHLRDKRDARVHIRVLRNALRRGVGHARVQPFLSAMLFGISGAPACRQREPHGGQPGAPERHIQRREGGDAHAPLPHLAARAPAVRPGGVPRQRNRALREVREAVPESMIRASIVLAILVPVALVAVSALTPTAKVVLLTVWLCWVVVTFVFLVVLETLRFNFRRQMKLGNMAGDRLIGLVSSRVRKGGGRNVGSKADKAEKGSGGGNASVSAGDKGGGHE